MCLKKEALTLKRGEKVKKGAFASQTQSRVVKRRGSDIKRGGAQEEVKGQRDEMERERLQRERGRSYERSY